MFQNQVEKLFALGLVGEPTFDAPIIAQSAILKSADATNNVVGRAFTVVEGATATTPLTVTAGGNGAFAGLLGIPKSYAAADLTPTLTLPNDKPAELILSGEIIVATDNTANVGDIAFYDIATGILSFAAAGTATPEGKMPIPNATLHFYQSEQNRVGVLKF